SWDVPATRMAYCPRLTADLAGRETVDEAVLLADVRSAIAGEIRRQHALLRYEQPGRAIPGPPMAFIIDEGAGRPAVGIVAATGAGVQRRMPGLVDVVHRGMTIAMLATLRERRSDPGCERYRTSQHQPKNERHASNEQTMGTVTRRHRPLPYWDAGPRR